MLAGSFHHGNAPVTWEDASFEDDQIGSGWPVLICLFGGFQLLVNGAPMATRPGGRTEALLATLGMRYRRRMPRDVILGEVWPDSDPVLSGQALNSLVHSLHKQLADALKGAAPVICAQGTYELNLDAGVGVDVAWFDELAARGDRQARGQSGTLIPSYLQAIRIYGGDLRTGDDQQAIVERERLRARYLTLLARTASQYYEMHDEESCLVLAHQLLAHDPCREDAHRLVMRCHVHLGERAQAMRQFHLCRRILRSEMDAEPEPATLALYDQIRLDPASV